MDIGEVFKQQRLVINVRCHSHCQQLELAVYLYLTF